MSTLAAVELGVHGQLVLRAEQLAALHALELALGRVRAHVLHQLGPRVVRLAAVLADETIRVAESADRSVGRRDCFQNVMTRRDFTFRQSYFGKKCIPPIGALQSPWVLTTQALMLSYLQPAKFQSAIKYKLSQTEPTTSSGRVNTRLPINAHSK